MYGIGGERELEESELDHLPGYAELRPVRIGNAAYAQQQHDVWGALLDSVYLHSKAVDHLDNRIWPILDKQVARRSSTGASRTPASGRCAASCGTSRRRRSCAGSRSTAAPGWPGWSARTARPPSGSWPPTEIKEDILANGVDERGVFTQYYGGTALDASLLLAPLVRFLPADDPRIRRPCWRSATS
jgi:GH15 family glucan-1,4-alpha-glucosidase